MMSYIFSLNNWEIKCSYNSLCFGWRTLNEYILFNVFLIYMISLSHYLRFTYITHRYLILFILWNTVLYTVCMDNKFLFIKNMACVFKAKIRILVLFWFFNFGLSTHYWSIFYYNFKYLCILAKYALSQPLFDFNNICQWIIIFSDFCIFFQYFFSLIVYKLVSLK